MATTEAYDPLSHPGHSTPDWYTAFEFNQPAIITTAKSDRLIEQGPEQLVVVLDWDGVVTDKELSGPGGTNWGVMRKTMTSENQVEHQRLYRYYHAHEKAGTLTEQRSHNWQRRAFALMGGVALNHVVELATETVRARHGAKEFFDRCAALGIATVIKSTGEATMIEAEAEANGFEPTHIFANRFHVVGGIITPYDANDPSSVVIPGTFTHSHNKRSFSHHAVVPGPPRSNILSIGDNFHDLEMVPDQEAQTVLRSFQDGGKDRIEKEEGSKRWQELQTVSSLAGYYFDMLSIQDTFDGHVRFINAVGGNHQTAAQA